MTSVGAVTDSSVSTSAQASPLATSSRKCAARDDTVGNWNNAAGVALRPNGASSLAPTTEHWAAVSDGKPLLLAFKTPSKRRTTKESPPSSKKFASQEQPLMPSTVHHPR